MEIRAMEMNKVVIEEKLRVLEEELQMKKWCKRCKIIFMDIIGS